MKKTVLMIIRIGLLLVMVVAGFLTFFPEWWDLRDMHRSDQVEQAQSTARANRTASLQAERSEQKSILFSQDQFIDSNFLTCLLDQGKDHPEQIVNLDCSSKYISDVTGISSLTGLTRLNLSGNNIAELDLSDNLKLSEIDASDNMINHVQLPREFLHKLDLSGNHLTTFKLGQATRLESVDVNSNRLTSLSLTASATKHLWAENNILNTVNLNHLSNLETLSLRQNQLETLDLNEFSQLKYVDLSFNPLKKVTVKDRQKLQSMLLSHTQLAPDVIQALRQKVSTIGLLSVPESQYPDPVFRRCVEAHLIEGVESLTEISCDRNKIGLLTHRTAIQDVSGLEKLYALKEINLGYQEIESINVSNLLRLEKLHINNNKLKHLDVRTNSNLQSLNAAYNSIKQIQLQNNQQIESLNLSANELTSLDTSQIPNIKTLRLNDNQLASLDVTKTTLLKSLWVNNNQLKRLDTSNLRFPTQLSFKNNPLGSESITQLRNQFWPEYADLSDQAVFLKKPKLPVFTAEEQDFPDPLFKKCVENTVRRKQLNTLKEIKRLDCSYQDIVSLEGLQLLTGLEHLILQGIDAVELPLLSHPLLNNVLITELPLRSLDLSQLPMLKTIHVSRNQSLRHLTLPENHSIERITADYNALESLSVPDGKKLKWLQLQNNQLEQLTFGQLNQLVKLDVTDNRLTLIDLRPLTALKKLIIAKNYLTELDLSQNLELQELFVAFNQIESLNLDLHAQMEGLVLFNNPLKVPDLTHMNKLKDLALDQSQYDDMLKRKMYLGFDQEPQFMGSAIILSK